MSTVNASGASSWPSSGEAKNAKPVAAMSSAAAAVGAPPPRDKPEGGEGSPDQPEDHAQAVDRALTIEHERLERERLGRERRDRQRNQECA